MKDHFDKIFWYIAGTAFAVILFVFMITFFQIPEKNQRFVDIALAFLLGFISSNTSYLTGGNPSQVKKAPNEPGSSGEEIKNGDQVTVTKE